MAHFQTKADLPASDQAELARIQALTRALTSVESAFLTSRNDYVYNEILLKDSAEDIMIARGVTIPTGLAGFAVGAFFTKVDAAAGTNSLYQNAGTTSAAVWVGVGGRVEAVSLTSAQIKALHTTPISLVAAQGAGTVIIVDEVLLKMTFATAAYTGANNLEIRYTDGSGAKATADFDKTAFLNIASGSAYQLSKGVVTALIPVANAAIVAAVPTADPAAGSGTIAGFVRFHVVTL